MRPESPPALSGILARRRARSLAEKVLLRACAVQRPEDWDGWRPTLLRLDADAWRHVALLTARHGLTCLIARNLAWTTDRCGFVAPIQAALSHGRRERLALQLQHRTEAQRLMTVLAAEGVNFVLLKGFSLAEEIYGDISLRGFGDCDILVPTCDIDRAYTVLLDRGYQPKGPLSIAEHMARQEHAIAMSGPGGASVDLHWALAAEIFVDRNDLVWRQVMPPQGPNRLPGLRLSPEMTLVHLAVHFHHHNFTEMKPLVDFYVTALRLADRISAKNLFETARALDLLDVVDLAVRLCQRHFIPQPALERLVDRRAGPRVRAAALLLTRRALLQTKRDAFSDWAGVIRRRVLAGNRTEAGDEIRRTLLPTPAELAQRYRRPFGLSLYGKYYGRQIVRAVTRSAKPFGDPG